MQKIQEAFQVEDSNVSEGEFRFCGREIAQGEEGSIKITCKSTAEKIEPISYRTGVRKTELANDAEKSQLRSVVGLLAWVARQARPDLSYREQTSISLHKSDVEGSCVCEQDRCRCKGVFKSRNI